MRYVVFWEFSMKIGIANISDHHGIYPLRSVRTWVNTAVCDDTSNVVPRPSHA